jgi:hypothetical protein
MISLLLYVGDYLLQINHRMIGVNKALPAKLGELGENHGAGGIVKL